MVTFYAPSATQDGYGEQVSAWTAIYTCHAHITQLARSILQFSEGQFVSKSTHRISIRYAPSLIINEGMRVVGPDNTYLIEGLGNVEGANYQVDIFAYVVDAKES
jgi:SPP1 family predicted phage head-tail adaptor